MIDLSKFKSFQWDKWNIDKSYEKHKITANESEEIFLDENLQVIKDVKHSQKEARFIAIGKTSENKILFAVFTLRKIKIRIISVRKANKKERSKYEKAQIASNAT